jgi:alginate O-acetyltransferase complex protein AlgI
MLLVILGWVLFDTADLPAAFGYIRVMFGAGGSGALYDNSAVYALLNYSVILLVCLFACTNLWRRVYNRFYPKIPVVLNYGGVLYQTAVFAFAVAYLVDAGYNPFLYFNF